MRDMLLQRLPVLGTLLMGTLLVPGLIIALNLSFQCVYGRSHDSLFGLGDIPEGQIGFIPEVLLASGIGSFIAGFFWIEFAYWGEVRTINFWNALGFGSLFGFVNVGFVHAFRTRRKIPTKHETRIFGLFWGRINGFAIILTIGCLWEIFGDISGPVLWLLIVLVIFWVIIRTVRFPDLRRVYRIGSWLAGTIVMGSLTLELPGFFFGLIFGLLVGKSLGVLIYSYIYLVFPLIHALVRSTCILAHFTTVLCNNCLRTTYPLKSRYEDGTRYCEHCGKPVEDTKERGELCLVFGDFLLTKAGRRFILRNPTFEEQQHRIDTSNVYIDTNTCDVRLLERFITFTVNYPPEQGLDSVRIFYRGGLDKFGANMRNSLRNNFEQILVYEQREVG